MNKLLSLFLFIFLISCSSPNDDTTPSLTIVNQNSSFPIVEVSLAGYKFENLNITSGISKTFQLSNGIDGLWNTANVQIIISCGRQMPLYRNTTLVFDINQTITIVDSKPDDTTPMNCGDAVIK
ncbi:hypothetical protein N9J98_03495 [Flavobacteriaceae bacterium]|jgi:hypothetical protein|nr:hypothetical protein [Flavobacteriaceae bacterium]|tara:strand:- start:237 stop:608 length:372 start_codon:yes stop_codon:yes gene_type:complete